MNERDDILEQLSAYLDGELEGADLQRVQEALAADESLRDELAALEATRRLVHELPRHRLGERFTSRVLARAHQRAVLPTRYRTLRWVTLAATAAVIIVGVGTAVVVMNQMAGPQVQPAGKRSEGPMPSGPAAVAPEADRTLVDDTRDSDGRLAKGGDEVGSEYAAKTGRGEEVPGRVDKSGEGYFTSGEDATRRVAKDTWVGGKEGVTGKAGPPGSGSRTETTAQPVAPPPVTLALYTDNLPAAQRDVEKVLAANNIEPLAVEPDTSQMAKASQTFARAANYTQAQTAPQQVVYNVVVAREQVPQLNDQINALQDRQNVIPRYVAQQVRQWGQAAQAGLPVVVLTPNQAAPAAGATTRPEDREIRVVQQPAAPHDERKDEQVAAAEREKELAEAQGQQKGATEADLRQRQLEQIAGADVVMLQIVVNGVPAEGPASELRPAPTTQAGE